MPRSIALSFEAHFADFLADAGLRESSIAKYRGIYKAHLAPLHGMALGAISSEDVADVLRAVREGGAAPRTVRNVLVCMRAAFAYAAKLGRIRRNPAKTFTVRVPRRSAGRALDAGERRALRTVLATEGLGSVERDALLVLLDSGLRVGELLGLRRGDVDVHDFTLRVRTSKTEAGERVVDVPHCLAHVIAGVPFLATERTLRRALKRYAAAAGIRDAESLRLHDLRHTRATALLEGGAPPEYVSAQMGHSSIAFTLQTYGHVVETAAREQRHRWAAAQ